MYYIMFDRKTFRLSEKGRRRLADIRSNEEIELWTTNCAAMLNGTKIQ